MSAPKNPRITLDPGAYHALCIQAAIEQTSPGSLASRVILSYSQEAKQALQAARRMAPGFPPGHIAQLTQSISQLSLPSSQEEARAKSWRRFWK